MKSFHTLATVLSCAMLFAGLSPAARADDYWNRRTFVTFSGAVEVPGAVLPAGKYVFKRAEAANPSDRHTVLITDLRETHVYARVLAIPSYRSNPSDKTVLTFYEVPAGNPPPVKLWFYAGDEWGQRFVYSSKRSAEIIALGKQIHNDDVQTASASPTETQPAAAVTEPQTTATEETTQAPDDGIQAPAPPIETTPEAAPSPAPVEETPVPEAQTTPAPDNDNTDNNTLPQTASVMPLVALIGILSIFLAVGLRTIRQGS